MTIITKSNKLHILLGIVCFGSFLVTPLNGFSVSAPKLAARVTLPISKVPSRVIAYSSISASTQDGEDLTNNNKNDNQHTLRNKLRQLTGFSLTAARATMRAATGISMSAIYASTFAATSAYVRKVMTFFLSIFPAWFRYFLQPFLILYYAPLFILRNLTGPTRKRAKETHEYFLEGWKQAVQTAENVQEDGYWPVHVNDDGFIVPVLPPHPTNEKTSSISSTTRSSSDNDRDMLDGIAESVDFVMENKMLSEDKK